MSGPVNRTRDGLAIVVSSPHRIDVGEKPLLAPPDYADFNSPEPTSHQDLERQVGITRCSA
jgi:hypothetical protein